jgi:hypothetical protein
VVNPDWHETDVATFAEGVRDTDPTIMRSIAADGARSGRLLPLLARVTTPTLLTRGLTWHSPSPRSTSPVLVRHPAG